MEAGNHTSSDAEFVTHALSLEDQLRLVKMGAYIEHTFVTLYRLSLATTRRKE